MTASIDISRISFAPHLPRHAHRASAPELGDSYRAHLSIHAPLIFDFARWVLSRPALRGHQLFFVGRSMDLPYLAATFIARTRMGSSIPARDLFLIDFSRSTFPYGFPPRSHYAGIRAYFEGCGLDPRRPIAIVDDIYLSGKTAVYLKEILLAFQLDTKIVVIHDDEPFREDGDRPNFAFSRTGAYDYSATRGAAMFLSKSDGSMGVDIYDPARAYEVVPGNGALLPTYTSLNFAQWSHAARVFLSIGCS